MAISAEERERILEEVSNKYSKIMADNVQNAIDNDEIVLYTDEELEQNMISEDVANSYTI